MIIAENITTALKNKGMTQKQLAEQMHVNKSAVQKWCSNNPDYIPSGKNLIKMSKILECDTDYLLGLQDIKQKADKLLSEKAGITLDEAQKISSLHYASKEALSYLLKNDNALDSFLENLYKISNGVISNPYIRDDYRKPPAKKKKVRCLDDLSRQEYHKMVKEFENRLDPLMQEVIDIMIDSQLKNIKPAVDIFEEIKEGD